MKRSLKATRKCLSPLLFFSTQEWAPAVLCLTTLLLGRPAAATTISSCSTPSGAISCTGTASTPEDVFLESFTLGGSAAITVQTYGFGGGTNAAGTSVMPGGFDSLVALFSGTSATASILTDGGGNPIASADNLSLFSPGCPPAGFVTVGSVTGVCGDSKLTAILAAGTYTLLLSDANYVPFAVNPGPPVSSLLSDGFGDLSGGVFQTCASQVDCNTDSGKFAVDITGLGQTSAPEPGTLTLFAAGLAVLFSKPLAARKRRIEEQKKGETI
jgi:PEP-CTERM motif-containing protein